MVLLGFLGKITGIQVPTLGKICSLLFEVASIGAIWKLTLEIEPRAAFIAAILTGTSVYFIYWSLGGSETTLFTFTLLSLIIAYAHYLSSNNQRPLDLIWTSAATILFLTVRPESPIVLTCTLVGAVAIIVVARREPLTTTAREASQLFPRLLVLLAISTITSMFIFLFRYWYFGSLFPEPVVAKLDGVSMDILNMGITYLGNQILGQPPVAIMVGLVIVGVIHSTRNQIQGKFPNPYVWLSLIFLAIYVLFILFSGGDWMEGGRFLVPILPIGCLFIALSLFRLAQSKITLSLGLVSLLAIQGMGLLNFSAAQSFGMPIWNEVRFAQDYGLSQFSWFETHSRVNMRDIPTIYYLDQIIDPILSYKRDKVSIVSGQMGMVAFHVAAKYYPRVQFIDMYGLSDRTLIRCPVTQNQPRTRLGLQHLWEAFFQKLGELKRDCGISEPDIVYDVRASSYGANLSTFGYTVVFAKTGYVTPTDDRLFPGKGWFKRRAILADDFIAVRDDLLPYLNHIDSVQLSFGVAP